MKKETLEECFLANIKNVLQFGNDAQAIRFMEKYFEAKKEQERSYSKEEVIGFLIDRERDLQLYDMANDYEDAFKWFEQFKKK